MGRLLVWTLLLLLLLLLSVSIFGSSTREKGSLRPQKQKNHRRVCPCDGFAMAQPGRHRRHSHGKIKHFPHHRKQRCRTSPSNCKHRRLIDGLQIPL